MSPNMIYVPKSLLKPYGLNEICIPFNIDNTRIKNHIVINADDNDNQVPVKKYKKTKINNFEDVEFKFKVPGIVLEELKDINKMIQSKSSSIDNSFFSSRKEAMKNKLELSRSKTDSSVYGTKNTTAKSCPIGLEKTVNNTNVLLLRFGDEVIACESKCPHKGAPLNEGDIENLFNGDRVLQCPWHHFKFNLDKNGLKEYPLVVSPEIRLKMYKTEVKEKGEIFITFNEFNLTF